MRHTYRRHIAPPPTIIQLMLLLMLINGCQYEQQQHEKVAPTYNLKHTKLRIKPQFETSTLQGEAWITLTPTSQNAKIFRLDAKSMQIHRVAIPTRNALTPIAYTYDGYAIDIPLQSPHNQTDSITIYIHYTADPQLRPQQSVRTSNDTKGIYFFAPDSLHPNTPTQVWTLGQTEYSSCWFPTIDKPEQKTTLDIEITVPNHLTTLSNGLLTHSKPIGDSLRSDRWILNLPHAPYLTFFAAGEFAIVHDAPWRDSVPLAYYVPKRYESTAKRAFSSVRQMIEFYSTKFGYPYPWPKYAQIVLHEFVAGGMENTTAVAYAESALQTPEALADGNYWETNIAHEAAHHWFGNLITATTWTHLPVNEGFATYAEYLWLQEKYGQDIADLHLYETQQLYLSATANYEKSPIRSPDTEKEAMFDNVSYEKSGAILHMLRTAIGDLAFFKGISLLLHQHAFSTANIHQVQNAFEMASGKSLRLFFEQWFLKSGHPIVRAEYHYESKTKQLLISITQEQPKGYFAFDCEIDIYQDGIPKRHTLPIKAKRVNRFSINLTDQPQLVDLNPSGYTLLQETTERKQDHYLYLYQHAPTAKSRRVAIDYAIENQIHEMLLLAIKDPCPPLRCLALEQISPLHLSPKQLEEIERIAQYDSDSNTRGAALWLLANCQQPSPFASLFEDALYTQSAAIQNAAIHGIARTNTKLATEFLQDAEPESLSTDQTLTLSPIIVERKILKHIGKLLPYFAHHATLGNSEQSKMHYRMGFEWAISIDSTELLIRALDPLREIFEYSPGNQENRKAILETLRHARDVKKRLQNSPASLKQQEIINGMIAEIEKQN